MCDKCGSKSADIELYCKNCGADLQIFGAGGEKVKPSTAASQEAQTGAAPPAESSLPDASSMPPSPFASSSSSLPPSPFASSAPSSPGSFGELPGFPLPSVPPASMLPPESTPPPAFEQGEGLSLSPRSVQPSAPSSAPPLSGPGEQGQNPVDFSFLGKPPEKKADEEQNSSSPPPSPGTFNPDFFKPKDGK